MLYVACYKVEMYFSKIGFVDCIWSNLNALVSFTFGVNCGVTFPLYEGKGKRCMWPINKEEIYFAEIGFVDYK